MLLIMEDENTVDTHVKMATFDESPKEKANGLPEEVNQCNGNKENIENTKLKDSLNHELPAKTDIASSEKIEDTKDVMDVENNLQEDISSSETKKIFNNECENPTDILIEDIEVKKQASAEDQDTINSETSIVINKNGSHLENESSANNDSDILKIDVTETKTTNGDICKDTNVDKDASIEDVSHQSRAENDIKNYLNNTLTAQQQLPCQDNETQEEGVPEDGHDATIAKEISPQKSVDNDTDTAITSEVNTEENVTKTLEKGISVETLENTVVNETSNTEEGNNITEREEESSDVITLENTDSEEITSSTNNVQEESKGIDDIHINSSMETTDSRSLKNEPEHPNPVTTPGKKKEDVHEMLTDSMEITENIELSCGEEGSEKDTELKSIIDDEKQHNKNNTEGKQETQLCTKPSLDLEPKPELNNTKTTLTNVKEEESNNVNETLTIDIVKDSLKDSTVKTKEHSNTTNEITIAKKPIRTSRLSNTLDILSDDEDEIKSDPKPMLLETSKKQCISLDDDDDVLLVDDTENNLKSEIKDEQLLETVDVNIQEKTAKDFHTEKSSLDNNDTEIPNVADIPTEKCSSPKGIEKMEEDIPKEKPFIPENFLNTCKKSVAEMTREELEEFCVLRIVESVLDKSSLNDIKAKLKTMVQNLEDCKKKAMVLAKQNRDLQVVLKSVQEELKKNSNTPITPLKITRSVGMQVCMMDKGVRKKAISQQPNTNQNTTPKPRNTNNVRQQNAVSSQTIPVPRLVPAQNIQKTNPQVNNQKITPVNNGPNSVKKPPVNTKVAEKRPRTSSQSITVDLTDDEPPAKTNRSAVNPVRLVNQQSLMASRPTTPQGASPRKVFIPISPQTQPVRPGQAIMLRPPAPGNNTAVRGPNTMRMRLPNNSVRVMRMNNYRHPAPLPDHVKQYQPPNWKQLPPAPDLKLSKVENGIVISWKIDGYLEDLYEEIASYQLYAYQETSVAPSTSLWKKIGDVKALPLPMACTLTQFMTGYKYFFAVRAVDIRSRVGPFSLPGSILLLNQV